MVSLESHHAGALEQLRTNVQLVENVLLEKVCIGLYFKINLNPNFPDSRCPCAKSLFSGYIQDQAVIRVKQLEEETQMLKKSLEDLVAEAGERTKREAGSRFYGAP